MNTLIQAWFNRHAQFVSDLQARWQDEQDYEDFDDYRQAVKKTLPPGVTLVRMTSRPFAVLLAVEGAGTFNVKVGRREVTLEKVAA